MSSYIREVRGLTTLPLIFGYTDQCMIGRLHKLAVYFFLLFIFLSERIHFQASYVRIVAKELPKTGQQPDYNLKGIKYNLNGYTTS